MNVAGLLSRRELEWAITRQPSLAATLKHVLDAAATARLPARIDTAGGDEVDAKALAEHGVPTARLRAKAADLGARHVIWPGAASLLTDGSSRVEMLLRDALAQASADLPLAHANATCALV